MEEICYDILHENPSSIIEYTINNKTLLYYLMIYGNLFIKADIQ